HAPARRAGRGSRQALGPGWCASVPGSRQVREPGMAHASQRDRRARRSGVHRMKQLPVVQPAAPVTPATELVETRDLVADAANTAALRPTIAQALWKVFDREIPVNIYELGLIYDIIVDAASVVGIRMTLTAPACPAAQSLPLDVKKKVAEVPNVS